MATQHPHLSLNSIRVDRGAARQLPYGLAVYYQAIPVARSRNAYSVAMAHPDDRAARSVLQSLLGARIVPVQAAAAEIRAAIDAVWKGDDQPAVPRILCWGAAEELAQLIAGALGAQVMWLDAAHTPPETALTVAREGGYRLTILERGQADRPGQLICESATPLMLAAGEIHTVRRILLVLRGHSPDASALEWIITLGQATGASVTLLAVAPPTLPLHNAETRRLQGLAVLLSPECEPGGHIYECARRLNEAGISGRLNLRQGPAPRQIADEIVEGNYDLIAIAAESKGEFVQAILDEVDHRQTRRPVLVLKPLAV